MPIPVAASKITNGKLQTLEIRGRWITEALQSTHKYGVVSNSAVIRKVNFYGQENLLKYKLSGSVY
jgi:hypothetical protein